MHAICTYLITLSLILSYVNAKSQFSISVESGVLKTGYNELQIPPKTGSLVSLPDEFDHNDKIYFRGNITYKFDDRNMVSLLYAPLRLKYTGEAPSSLYFKNHQFKAGEQIDAFYRFDSYRLTYAYSFINKERFELRFGLTAKIRDAEISFNNGVHKESYFNTGFVALFHIGAKYNLTENVSLNLVGDALAVKYGRAEDFLVSLDYRLNKKLSAYLGYRVLEGGSDGGSVYTFALFHYGAIGVAYRF